MRGLIKGLITTFILSIIFINAGYVGNWAVSADRIQDVSGSASSAFNIVTIVGLALLLAAIILFFWMIFKPVKRKQ